MPSQQTKKISPPPLILISWLGRSNGSKKICGNATRNEKYSLAGLRDRMCFLMTKCGIPRGESLFWCELSDFWDFMRTGEDLHSLYCVVMTISQGK